MPNYTNHLIDPFYFYDAIEQFAFEYDIYVEVKRNFDEYHRFVYTYEKQSIRGSLQTDGLSISQSKKGNVKKETYRFYCKSLYRIKDGDFIFYKGKWLHVDSVHEYDEWGVREVTLTMVQLSEYRDLAAYVKYINGEETV